VSRNSLRPPEEDGMGFPLRVLIVEDSEDDTLLLLRELEKGGYHPVWKRVDTAMALVEALNEGCWDIILSDYKMPRFDGHAALRLVTERGIDLPFIVISGVLLEETAVEILKGGANDYIRKGNWARLIPAIGRELREAQSRSAHRQAQKAREEAEARYRNLFENMVEGIFQSTLQGRFTSVNPAMARLLGYDSPEDMIDSVTDIREQLYVDHRKRDELFAQLKEHGSVSGFEVQKRRKDGSKIWVAIHARAVPGEDGEPKFIEGMLVDITSRKLAEEQKAQLEERLRQSQKMEAVGTLAGGIAHDFNNLLQAIWGNLQLLLMKKKEDDPDHKYLAEIEHATARAADLVRHLLTFSRKAQVFFRKVNLNIVVEGSVKLLKRTIPRMISIETRLAKDLPEIHADPIQMEQILMNLANNAADSMAEGGELVFETTKIGLGLKDLERYPEMEPGEYVLLKVSDMGHGMDGETLQHIFEPFFTTKEIGKGTGLGLSTVYGIVKAHRGHISCYSEVGQGTTFRVYLPALPGACPIPEEPTLREAEGWGRGETILIVDDEEFILEMADEMFGQHGYSIKKAESGESALEVYSRETGNIDLVILDLGMPGMGGKRCMEEILKLDPGAKIIVVSGYANHSIAQNPEAHGAAGFICKPYRLDDMLSMVRTILDRN